MPLPRYKQINTDVTPYYHCISRCVRQSYLCGRDARTGINYEHRRKWIQDRLHKLSQAFAIDLCAYAVMHNHIHIVLHVFYTFDQRKLTALPSGRRPNSLC